MKEHMSTIRIVGEINEEAFKAFSEELSALESSKKTNITLELFSSGGYAASAVAIAGRILASNIHIDIKAYGEVHSAAILIIAAGSKRSAGIGTSFMVHEDSLEVSGDTTEVRKTALRMENEEKLWAGMLEQFTGTKSHIWLELSHKETYFGPEMALKLGLIDRILNVKRKV